MRFAIISILLTISTVQAQERPVCSRQEDKLTHSGPDPANIAAAREEWQQCLGRVAKRREEDRARLERNQKDRKLLSLLHSAQLCANEQALRWTREYNAGLRRLGLEPDDESRYTQAVEAAKQALKEAGARQLGCTNKQVKNLIHCLPSVQDGIGWAGIGSPYGGPWCSEEPYTSAIEVERGVPTDRRTSTCRQVGRWTECTVED